MDSRRDRCIFRGRPELERPLGYSRNCVDRSCKDSRYRFVEIKVGLPRYNELGDTRSLVLRVKDT